MTRTFALIIGASMAIGSGAAMAASATGSQAEQARMHNLPYEVREDIQARMGPEQRVDELIETTRLNRAAAGGFAGTRDVEEFNRATLDRPWIGHDGAMATRSSDRYMPEMTGPARMGIHR